MKLFKKLNQAGFAHQVVILGAVVVLAVAAVGYKVLNRSHALVPGGSVNCSISGSSTLKYSQSSSYSVTIGNSSGYTARPTVSYLVSQYALGITTPVASSSFGTVSVPAYGSTTKSLGGLSTTNKAITKYTIKVTGSSPSFSCSKTVTLSS